MWGEIFASALTGWELMVREVGWLHLLLALMHVGVAVLCLVCAYAASQNREPGNGWFIAAALLLLLGANTLLLLDQLLLRVLREMALQQGWYSDRRDLQSLAVGLGLAGGLVLLGWLRTRLDAVWPQCRWAVTGLGLLLALFALRGMSFHYTDEVIDQDLAGFSVGRALELGSLLMVVAGARRWLRAH